MTNWREKYMEAGQQASDLGKRIAALEAENKRLLSEMRRTIHRLHRIRVSADHYYDIGNKHRNLKGVRSNATNLLSRLCARYPDEAHAALAPEET